MKHLPAILRWLVRGSLPQMRMFSGFRSRWTTWKPAGSQRSAGSESAATPPRCVAAVAYPILVQVLDAANEVIHPPPDRVVCELDATVADDVPQVRLAWAGRAATGAAATAVTRGGPAATRGGRRSTGAEQSSPLTRTELEHQRHGPRFPVQKRVHKADDVGVAQLPQQFDFPAQAAATACQHRAVWIPPGRPHPHARKQPHNSRHKPQHARQPATPRPTGGWPSSCKLTWRCRPSWQPSA